MEAWTHQRCYWRRDHTRTATGGITPTLPLEAWTHQRCHWRRDHTRTATGDMAVPTLPLEAWSRLRYYCVVTPRLLVRITIRLLLCRHFKLQFEQVADPIKLTWRQGKRAPEAMTACWGAAVVHEDMAYFSRINSVYSYTLAKDQWTKPKQCEYFSFGLAIVNNKITTIGGSNHGTTTKLLLCPHHVPFL